MVSIFSWNIFFAMLIIKHKNKYIDQQGEWQQDLLLVSVSLLYFRGSLRLKWNYQVFFLWFRLLSVEMHKINDLWKRCSGFCSLYKTANTGIGGKIVYKPVFSISALPIFSYFCNLNQHKGRLWEQLLLLLGGAVLCPFAPNGFCPMLLIQSWRRWQALLFWHRPLSNWILPCNFPF